ncbi:hypothetical protein [Aquibium sp. ELW1220]|uniref:FitA-like ribbon-helix-helix domain-containing protein n=1 Tax=Aquibium sp. ELW1220 TaxID=2976766 RepID=UPI0025AF68C1|nr:hypothetical protein [Aquibium sp. ELW1220]MDN2582593.1 hypothetical protein [Aquibium sp. ELW1220]
MGEITIRLSDATVIEALEEMASIHGRPVEEEARSVLERAVEDHRHRTDLIERARQIRAMTPTGVKQTDSVEIIRAMREERDRALGG